MSIKLGGWQRIGIVLSAIWLLLGFYLGNDRVIRQADWVGKSYLRCIERPNSDGDKCNETFDREYAQAISFRWYEGLIVAVVPVLPAWPAAYGLARLVRWIKAGFERS